jgi:hypothetical protein
MFFVTVVTSRGKDFVSKINTTAILPPYRQAEHVLPSKGEPQLPNVVVFCQQNQQRNIGPEDKACLVLGREHNATDGDRTDPPALDVGPRSNSGGGFSCVVYYHSDASRCIGSEVTLS